MPRSGRHKIAGTVTVDGLPAERIVAAFNRKNFAFIDMTASDPVTGAWEISGVPELPERTLLVVAIDSSGNYNAEVADYVSQVVT